MGLPAATKPVTVEEYLSNPAFEHCEFVDGNPVELNVGGKPHAKIQAKCVSSLDRHLAQQKGATAYVATELHCRLKVAGHTRFRLPDVAVVLADDSPEQRYLDRAPDLVVEIRSPDDSLSELLRKMDEYFTNGAKLAWLVLPEEKSLLVIRPDTTVRTVVAGETLDGGDVLPGLCVRLDELFA